MIGLTMENQNVTDLNNFGAYLISCGKSAEAIYHFGQALRYSKQRIRESEEEQRKEPKVSFTTSFDSWLDRSCSLEKHSSGFVYSHPMIIPQNTPSNVLESNVLMASAILFNMALAHHLAPDGGAADKRKSLTKAALLYKDSMTLSRTYRNGNEKCLLFTMAVLNNLGTCHRALGRHANAELWFGALLQFVLFLQASPEKEDASNYMQRFFENISHLFLPNSGPTAPAA
jgi:tetratricopeptide (TPR) repeat protein